MSSVLAALLARQKSNQENIRGIGDIFERDRLKSLGREFLQYGDYSPQGLQAFAQQKGLGANEMQALVEVATKFRQHEKESLPVTESFETMTPEGGKATQVRNMEDPSADPLFTVQKELPKLQRTDILGSEGGKVSGGYNPFTNTVLPSRGPSGLVKTELPQQDAKEKSIQRLVAQGTPIDRATKIIEGGIRVGTDAFGRTSMLDLTEPQKKRGPMGMGAIQDEAGGQDEEFKIKKEDFGEGMGPVSGVRQLLNNMFGFMKKGMIFPDTAEARNKLKIFNHNLRTALVNNPKFPVSEQETVAGFLTDPDPFFQDPDEGMVRIKNLHDFLINQKKQKANMIMSDRITGDQFKTFTDQMNIIDSALSMFPDFNQETPEPTGLEEMTDEELLRELGL